LFHDAGSALFALFDYGIAPYPARMINVLAGPAVYITEPAGEIVRLLFGH
jgi:hypothetical protein